MSGTFFRIYYGPAFQSAQLERRTLVVPPSLAAFEGLSILFMTDLHVSRMFPEKALVRLIDQTAALRPDILCLGGDLAESEEDQAVMLKHIGRVSPRCGAFAVPGNNDRAHFYQNGVSLTDRLRECGVTMLVDAETHLDLPQGRLTVAGLNALTEHTRPASPLFAGARDDELRILMAHYPQSLSLNLEICAAVPHLGLAGHTHGGQFRFLGLTPYSIYFERRMASNLMPIAGWNDMLGFPILVSPGIGTSRLPFRLNVPPAIHLITLTARPQS